MYAKPKTANSALRRQSMRSSGLPSSAICVSRSAACVFHVATPTPSVTGLLSHHASTGFLFFAASPQPAAAGLERESATQARSGGSR